MFKLIAFIFLLVPIMVFAQSNESVKDEYSNIFSGRVSRINKIAHLVRVRTDFNNIKFLNRSDRVAFWSESHPDQKCIGLLEGRTNDYFLIRVLQFDSCIRRVHISTGSYLHFESEDLQKTVSMASELVQILLKKRLAMQAKKERHKLDLTTHIEKVDAVNKRYEILRQKLEIEWQKELSLLEEDKAKSFTDFKNAEARLNEIDTKLESYRIEDHNLKLDRWSLDPAQYTKR